MISQSIILAAALALQPPAPTITAPDEVVAYRLVKGDNLYTLAERHFARTADFAVVQRENHIRNPYRMPVGSVVRIRKALLRFEPISARVLSYRGEIHVIRPRGEVPITPGLVLGEGDEIATGADGFVSLSLPDASTVALPSQSRVVIARLRKLALTDGLDRRFELKGGRAHAIVTPMTRPDDNFRVSTPLATSAVRGTEFRMAYVDGGQRVTTEVLKGVVEVAAGPALQRVSAGFGTVASPAGGDAQVALLPAPELARPGRVQDEAQLAFSVTPSPEAVAYRVQVARDAGFLDVVEETVSAASEANLPAVSDGTWFVRASSISRDGLEGAGATYGFERRLNRIEASLETRQEGRSREYLFLWRVEGRGSHRFRFQLTRDADGGRPMIDEAGLTDRQFVATDLPPGSYHWRVMTLQFVDGAVNEKWSPLEQLTISAKE
jgi:hypothetical protein